MKQPSPQGEQIRTFYSPELDMDLNVIDRETFSNFDRWHLILLLSQTYNSDEKCLYDNESHKILIKDLKCTREQSFDLNDPTIFGLLEILKLTQYDLSTITLWNVWGVLSELSRGDAIGLYDIQSGLNKILKSSIKPKGLSVLEQFLNACKLRSLKDISRQKRIGIIDIDEKLRKHGSAYQNVVSLVSEDKQEIDSDYAFYEFELTNLFISSSIESCYKNLSESCNIARKIHGISPGEEDHYGAVIDLIYISRNGASVIEFQPKRNIKIFDDKGVVLRDHQFSTVFTGEDPDLIKTIMSTNDPFHRKIRGKILENDLGM